MFFIISNLSKPFPGHAQMESIGHKSRTGTPHAIYIRLCEEYLFAPAIDDTSAAGTPPVIYLLCC